MGMRMQINLESDPDVISRTSGETNDEPEGIPCVPQPDPAKRRHFEFSIPEGFRATGWRGYFEQYNQR